MVALFLLGFSVAASVVRAASPDSPVETSKIQEVIRLVGGTPTGRELLQRAIRHWGLSAEKALLSKVRLASVSKTDAVITRHWDPVTGKERREREVTVQLKEDQSVAEMALDLVHEMTHALADPSWDPYDPKLTPLRYIQATLESPGGEVDAIATECKFVRDTKNDPSTADILEVSRCQRYWQEGGKISREKILEDFYRVGKYHATIQKILGQDAKKLAFLSAREPVLYSSTGRAPYPAALIREYEDLNQVACENSLRRFQMSSARSEQPAVPAAEQVRRFLAHRCGF